MKTVVVSSDQCQHKKTSDPEGGPKRHQIIPTGFAVICAGSGFV